MAKGDIYEVFIEGQYYAQPENGMKAIKPYKISFFADDAVKQSGFLSAFRNSLIHKDGTESQVLKQMREKYPDYKRFRTHLVTETVNLSQKGKPVKELALMNRAQVIRYIDKKGLPIDTDLYPQVSELRQAVKDWRLNPETFERQQEKRRITKGPEIAVLRSMDELNSPDSKAVTLLKQAPAKAAPITHPEDDIIDDDDDVDGIPEFDDEDELDQLIQGI